MRKQKKSTLPPEGFTPANESSLTGEWLITEDVMKKLSCSLSTVKNQRKKKLLPFSKVGGLIFYNPTDVQQMLVHARRLSLFMMMPVLWLTDFLEMAAFDMIA